MKGNCRRKGFVFTLVFAAIFLALLSQALFFAGVFSEREGNALLLKGSDRKGAVSNDVATDLLSFLEANFSAHSESPSNPSGAIVLRSWDALPSTLRNSNPQTLISEYETFVSSNYSSALNYNVSINASALSQNPFVFFQGAGVNHSYSSLEKYQKTILGTASVSNYSLFLQAIGGDSFEGCGWISQTAGATLNASVSFNQITQSSCNSTSVLLDASAASVFFANTSSGKTINFTFGLVAGVSNSLRVEQNSSNPVLLVLRADAVVQSPSAFKAWLPVSINYSIDNSSLARLVILEK